MLWLFKQPPKVLYKHSYSSKFRNNQRKTPALVSLFNKVADLESLQHRCFAVNIVKFLRIPFLKKHLRTVVSAHFKIKRRIQHPVNYLRCFWKKLLVRCLTFESTYLEKKLLSFYHFFILSLSYLRQYKIICPTQNTFTSRPIFKGKLISMQALLVKWSFSVKTSKFNFFR